MKITKNILSPLVQKLRQLDKYFTIANILQFDSAEKNRVLVLFYVARRTYDIKNPVSVLFYVARRRDDIIVRLFKIALRRLWYWCRRNTWDDTL